MKKRILSLALALLMMLSLCPFAAADITYTSPGDVELGKSLRHLLATVAVGSSISVTEGSVPPGCGIYTEQTSDGLNVYLEGTPKTVGRYDCIIDLGSGSSLICPVNVVLPKLSLTVSGDVLCYPNETAELTVSSTPIPGAVISYQWYISDTDSASGSPIPYATNPRCLADTAYVGSKYYYCIVTASIGNQSQATVSDVIRVQVDELQIASIAVHSLPVKTEYMEGEMLDSTGLSILVTYATGETRLLQDGFGLFPTQLDQVGQQEIQVSFRGKSCVFPVKVESEEELLEKIEISSLPRKTKYELGEKLDTAGLILLVTTNKQQFKTNEGFSCVPDTLNLEGEQTITVRYEDQSCTFPVTVEKPEVPIRIDVASRASKLEYTVGDSLDTTGLIIRVMGSNGGSEEVRSGFTCSPSVLSSAGRQKITVTYQELQCTYYVTVSPASPVATQIPQPSGTVAPSATPIPTQAPDNSEHKPYDTGISSTVLVVVIVISLLIMAGLGAYVFIMQNGGIENILRRFKKK